MLDVLVVGAGPTGLMLANQLARRGVRPRIVDKNAHPSLESRALGVQARTLEIYNHLGIAEKAIELGRSSTGTDMWSLGKRVARVPLTDSGETITPYPYLLILGQDSNEKLLGDRLVEAGISVEWNRELVAISQETDRVVAKLKRPDGSVEDVAARWLAGCDGSKSAVRQLSMALGVKQERYFEESFDAAVSDAEPTTSPPCNAASETFKATSTSSTSATRR